MSNELAVLRVDTLPPDMDPLARAASAEGFGFVQRLMDEWDSGVNRFDLPGEALFVARAGPMLIGVCGLNRDPYAKGAKGAKGAVDNGIGRVRRLYVLPPFRRRGVGRDLTAAVLEAAHGTFDRLRLRTNNPQAAKFYEAIGFVAIDEEDATHERMVHTASRP